MHVCMQACMYYISLTMYLYISLSMYIYVYVCIYVFIYVSVLMYVLKLKCNVKLEQLHLATKLFCYFLL